MIRIWDEKVQEIPLDAHPALVGITVMSHTASRAYQLARHFRAGGSQVVLGGIHVTAIPQEAVQHADSIVIGEAEPVWMQVIHDAKQHALRSFYKGATPALIGLPPPRWDLIDKQRYLTWQLVQTTRGCPFNCEFCSVTKFFGKKIRSRPLFEVISEIEALEGNWMFFMDDNIVANPIYAQKLFEHIKGFGKKFGTQASIHIADNMPILMQAAESGLKILFIGFESLKEERLAKFNRFKDSRVKKFREAIKKIHEQGISNPEEAQF